MQESWVIKQSVGVYSITTITKGHRPRKALFLSPLDGGKQVRDINWLDVAGDELSAVVNTTKKAAAIAFLQAEEDSKNTRDTTKRGLVTQLKALRPADLSTHDELRDGFIKLLRFLDLR